MKYLTSLYRYKSTKKILILLAILTLIYLPLFTPWGNRMMQPLLEYKLTGTFSTPIKIESFVLRHNRFFLSFRDTFDNDLSLQGRLSLLTLRLNANYQLQCRRSGGINPLKHPFKTHGALSGGIASFVIHGNADIYNGEGIYQVELHRFRFSNLRLKLSNLDYNSLMKELDYPSATKSRLFVEADLRGFDLRDVVGKVKLHTTTDTFKHLPIKKSDDNTSFDIRTLLEDQYGRIKPFDVHLTIDAAIQHAGVLEQFVGLPLKGPMDLKADLSGDEMMMKFKAQTSVAHSDTHLSVTIPKLDPTTISFDAHHANIDELFTLFTLPPPLKGSCNVAGDLNATDGTVSVVLTDGQTLPSVMKNHYHLTQPPIRFKSSLYIALTPSSVHYQGTFASDLTRMEFDASTTHEQMLQELLRTIR